jgi:hypothetical protein
MACSALGLVLGLDMGTYRGVLTFGNAGNIGLPVALLALRTGGLRPCGGDLGVMAIPSFTVGIWVVAGGGNRLTALREPLVWATCSGRPSCGSAGACRRGSAPTSAW